MNRINPAMLRQTLDDMHESATGRCAWCGKQRYINHITVFSKTGKYLRCYRLDFSTRETLMRDERGRFIKFEPKNI